MDGAADERLEQQLRGGEDDVLGALFESYRAQLTRMVTFRLDPRLVGRIDADDVLQDAFVEAEKRLGAFRGDDKPFLVWIRLITQQTMINLHRRHLGPLPPPGPAKVQGTASTKHYPLYRPTQVAPHLLGLPCGRGAAGRLR